MRSASCGPAMRRQVRALLWGATVLVALAPACGVGEDHDEDECARDVDCAPGERCAFPSHCPDTRDECGGSSCPRTCERPGEEGESCVSYEYDPGACRVGLFCNPASGTCTGPQPLGGACRQRVDCADAGRGAFCDPQGRGTCTLPGSKDEGEACGREEACGPDLTCRAAVCIPALLEGQYCGIAPRSCADDLACVGDTCR